MNHMEAKQTMFRGFRFALALAIFIVAPALAQAVPALPPITPDNADHLTRIAHFDTGSRYTAVTWLPGSPQQVLVRTAATATMYAAELADPLFTLELAPPTDEDRYWENASVVLETDAGAELWYASGDGTYERWSLTTGAALPRFDPAAAGFEGIEAWNGTPGTLREVNGDYVYVIDTGGERVDNDFGARLDAAYWELHTGRLLAHYQSASVDMRLNDRLLPGWDQYLDLLPADDNVWAGELALIDGDTGAVAASFPFAEMYIFDILPSRDGSILAVLNGETLHLLDRETLVEIQAVSFGASRFTNTSEYLHRVGETDLLLVRGAGLYDPTWSLLDMLTGDLIPLSFGEWQGFTAGEGGSGLQPLNFERFNAQGAQNWALLGPAGERIAYDSIEDVLFDHAQVVLDETGEPIIAEAQVHIASTDGTLIASLPAADVGLPQAFSPDDRLLVTYFDQWDVPGDEVVTLIDTSNGEIVAQFAPEVVPNTSETFTERANLPAENFQFSPDGSTLLFTYGGVVCCGGDLGSIIVEWWGIAPDA